VEARERRLQRFRVSEPPSEQMPTPREERNAVFPMTLDLRWPAPGDDAQKVLGTEP
jgi:hypothetical protein